MTPSRRTGIRHPVFGDLAHPRAVLLPDHPLLDQEFTEKSPAYIHLSITGRCNARCRGCINEKYSEGGGIRLEEDTVPERDARAILHLLEDAPESEVVICLYGGEPLLRMDRIETLMDLLDRNAGGRTFRYMLYTNGLRLGEAVSAHPGLIDRIWLYSVSIDGRAPQHDAVRCGAELEKVHRGLALLKDRRRGAVLMWSTLREEQSLWDCFEEFRHLHERGGADHFFWHWIDTDEPLRDFPAYVRAYEADLRQIMDVYLDWLGQGRILPVVHLNELLLYLLTGKDRGTTACAVETERNYDIVGGKIHACADLPLDFAMGTIDPDGVPRLTPFDLSSLVTYKKGLGCAACGVHKYCGGRCPVQAFGRNRDRLRAYCQLMRLHVGVVQDHVPRILDQLLRHGIPLQEIHDRSAYYAQFTDVTP